MIPNWSRHNFPSHGVWVIYSATHKYTGKVRYNWIFAGSPDDARVLLNYWSSYGHEQYEMIDFGYSVRTTEYMNTIAMAEIDKSAAHVPHDFHCITLVDE